jgi:hypothetical protein
MDITPDCDRFIMSVLNRTHYSTKGIPVVTSDLKKKQNI